MNARDLARGVLRRVEQGEAYATLALAAALERENPAPSDRGLATEIVYGVLRHRTRLDRALAAYATHGLSRLPQPALIALRVGAYQLLFLRVPAHAAVHDAVDAMKAAVDDRTAGARLARFANAVLRRLADEGEPPPPPATDVIRVLEEMHSMPRWLGQVLVGALGKEEAIAAAEALNRPAPVTLRIARVATGAADPREELAARVRAERPAAVVEPSPLAPDALLVRGGGAPESLAAFQEGLCTVQDVAAQLVGRLCGARPGERILDACSGVGGKATHLQALALAAAGTPSAGADIDAADLSRRKLDLGDDAARRLRLGGIRTVECDLTAADAPLAAAYDRVLLDAPCSGLGVLRRHPEAKWRRRPADVRDLAQLQARLLSALVPRVRPGGLLVYSVCTFTPEEGPEQVRAFLAAHPEFALAAPDDPAVDWARFLDGEGLLRTWPHRHDADGFFAARLRRRGS